ncbi:hypothetical protein GCM10010193_22980 [Kitasatospora atroaurantiaca]|uniref:Uncharacterized protein n=1 Tax=Kitasatospora atroaurantiaca TaxID=285545 RepID=A0A561EI37_9ACTN|nr:hypothetical protein FB465_0167 [Kitasatospora atroaurantiaca]
MLAGPGFWDREIEREGWSRVMSPSRAAFPEVAGLGTAWGRNFYVRGRDRLIMEWSGPVSLSAVILNGKPLQVESTEALSAAIRRGSDVP